MKCWEFPSITGCHSVKQLFVGLVVLDAFEIPTLTTEVVTGTRSSLSLSKTMGSLCVLKIIFCTTLWSD